MKHTRPITRMPENATSQIPTDTPFGAKMNFLVNMVDRLVTYVFQKASAL